MKHARSASSFQSGAAHFAAFTNIQSIGIQLALSTPEDLPFG
jgi:hypothetical protein